MSIVTRFAPSPTGYLHIGGARTALFNYLYARRMGGQFLLRVEDTDKVRNTPEAVQAIYGGLNWLGLHHDSDVVLQSERADRHREVALQLLDQGFAYYDEDDDRGSGPPLRFTGAAGDSITIKDLVQGPVTVQTKELDNMVLLRSDGSPTYMLAVVVDDHDMGVTHVIRGDDHLNNAFRQLPIYWAMNWPEPTYAHIPLILDENGKKLSKRTGAAAVEDYRDMGIRSEAMVNYLSRLGWGHGNDEIFSMEQAAEWFDIKDVGRNPARLDSKKLANINGHYIRQVEPHHLALEILPRLHERGIPTPPFDTITGAMAALRERSADMNALVDGTMFLWASRPLALAEPLDDAAKHILTVTTSDYLKQAEWTADSLHEQLGLAAELLGIKLGKVVAPLRMALTGSKVSPPITDTMLLLGRDETFLRIEDALNA